MPPDREAIHAGILPFLLSEQGRAAAAALAAAGLDDAQLLSTLQSLRRTYRAEEAAALVALVRLRRAAAAKFPAADRLFFTAEALEQATTSEIASYRAAWIDRHAPPGPVLDLGCGIGGDTLALAQYRPVIAVERDPLRLQLAQANVAALALPHPVHFILGDWVAVRAAGHLPGAAAAFADPARRIEGKRVFRLDALQPPLTALLALQETIPALGIKIMPGVDDRDLPAEATVEFISHAGVCKEAILWFGPLRGPGRRAAVHTPGGWQTMIASGARPPCGPLEPGMVLYEPDPALIRAGAFAELCAQLDAHLFDPDIAYLVSRSERSSPFAQRFRVAEIHPFSLKLLQQRITALGWGTLELKKRGAPFAPESLRGRLRLAAGGPPGVVIFTRRGDDRLMLLAQRLSA